MSAEVNSFPDETVPGSAHYPLSWPAPIRDQASDGPSDISLDEFLQLYKPSHSSSRMSLANGASLPTPWIYVRNRTKSVKLEDKYDEREVRAEAMAIADQVAMKVDEITNDETIPTRASKKNPTSKKMAKDKAYEEAASALRELAQKNKLLTGKWLFYPTSDTVDNYWERRSGYDDRKVYVICVYLPDSWNRDQVEEVLKVLVKDLSLVPNSFKADIYTHAGIDSKHASKMKSTLYSTKDFMSKEDIEAHFDSKRTAIKKKRGDDEDEEDFFDDEDEDEDEDTGRDVKRSGGGNGEKKGSTKPRAKKKARV